MFNCVLCVKSSGGFSFPPCDGVFCFVSIGDLSLFCCITASSVDFWELTFGGIACVCWWEIKSIFVSYLIHGELYLFYAVVPYSWRVVPF